MDKFLCYKSIQQCHTRKFYEKMRNYSIIK